MRYTPLIQKRNFILWKEFEQQKTGGFWKLPGKWLSRSIKRYSQANSNACRSTWPYYMPGRITFASSWCYGTSLRSPPSLKNTAQISFCYNTPIYLLRQWGNTWKISQNRGEIRGNFAENIQIFCIFLKNSPISRFSAADIEARRPDRIRRESSIPPRRAYRRKLRARRVAHPCR